MTGTKRDISISMNEAAVKSSLLIVPIAILQAAPFFLLHRPLEVPIHANTTLYGLLLLSGILFHELLHVFVWAFFAKKSLKAFKLGFDRKTLTPYAHCKEPMDIRPYRIGALAPGLLLGILPWFISLFTGDILLFFYGFLYTLSAGGDFLILWVIRNIKLHTLVEDHPSNAGCYVIEP